MFCESLGMNKTLRDLDLRNNQITHTSALELCRGIELNSTLESLDLRWNNIGLVGGKGILVALKKNFTLAKLQIVGNNIPDEIVEAISKRILDLDNQSLN